LVEYLFLAVAAVALVEGEIKRVFELTPRVETLDPLKNRIILT
jgi:hypothetical protein